jgi:hypothetical protein
LALLRAQAAGSGAVWPSEQNRGRRGQSVGQLLLVFNGHVSQHLYGAASRFEQGFVYRSGMMVVLELPKGD